MLFVVSVAILVVPGEVVLVFSSEFCLRIGLILGRLLINSSRFGHNIAWQ
jgi:hypothetical protein